MMKNAQPVKRSGYRHLLLGLLGVSMLITACDDYNIVEPRFYDKDDVVELPVCGVNAWKESAFWVDACWITGRPERTLSIRWRTSDSGPLKLVLLKSSGAVETLVFYDEHMGPHVGELAQGFLWGDRESGIYGLSLQAESETAVVWFEVK